MSLSVEDMLGNMSTASQSHELLEPTTRGAVLRSIVQWMQDQDFYDSHYHDGFTEALIAHEDHSK